MEPAKNPFKLKDSKEVYKNPWISVREDSVVRPDGSDGIFGVIDMQHGATVAALTRDGDIFLAHEYRYAVGKHGYECVGGGIDEGEDPLTAAKRETEEEIGGVSNDWVELGYIDPFTSIINSRNYLFLANNVELTGGRSEEDLSELKIARMPFEEALEKVYSSEITHGATVAAILRAHILLNQ